MLIVPSNCRGSLRRKESWGKGHHTIGPSEGQDRVKVIESTMGWGKAPWVWYDWVWGKDTNAHAVESEGRTSTRKKLDRSGLFRMMSSNGFAQGECGLKGCYLLAFMHIVSGVFSGCNSHTIASSMEADVQRFSPRLAFEWPHAC